MAPCLAFSPSALYLVGGLVVLGLVVYLGRYGGRSSTITWFRLFLLFTAGFFISTGGIRCSQTDATFQAMFVAFSLSTALVNPTLLIFALHFVGKDSWLSNLWLRLAILGSTVGFIYLFWQTSFFVSHTFSNPTLGYTDTLPQNGSHSELLGLAILISYVIPMILMARYQRTLEGTVKSKEERIVIAALAIAVLTTITFEGALPAIFSLPTYPLSPFAAVIMAAMVTYAITRHGLHVFNLDNATGNIMQVMPGGLVVLDHTHTIQYLNPGAAEMLGFAEGKLTGAPAKKLFKTTEGYGVFQTKVLAGLSPGRQVTGQEITFTTEAGDSLPVSVNAVNVYAGRELVSSLISFTDITARKQAGAALLAEKVTIEHSNQHLEDSQAKTLELLDEARNLQAQLKREKAGVERRVEEATEKIRAQRAQLEASVNSLPLGFVMTDKRGSIITTNQEIEGIIARGTGLKASDLGVDLNTIETILARIFQIRSNIKHCLKTGESFTKTNIQFRDTFLSIFVSPVMDEVAQDQKPIGVVILIQDITDAVAMQRSRDEFFSIASHELRTPLTAIRGNTEMMRDYFPAQFKDPSLAEMLSDIHESSVRLISIVNDFLDTSRLEQGKIEFKPTSFSPEDLVKEVMKEYQAAGLNPGIFIKAIPSRHRVANVFADHDRLKQALINLLSNALKFTEKGGVTIEVSSQPGCVVISVSDTGKGIPLESQHLLFRKFQQASNNILTRDSTRSTGLGLYISRLIMNSMGGAIELQTSDVGLGSTFILNVPVAKPSASPAKAKPAMP